MNLCERRSVFSAELNSQDAPADLKKLAADFDFPVVRDAGGQLARRLQVERRLKCCF